MAEEKSLQINLSYVLHEPSGSAAVRRTARAIRRFARRRNRLLSEFVSLTAEQLAARTVVSPSLFAALDAEDEPGVVVTASVGFPELIIPILRASRLIDSAWPDPDIVVLDRTESRHESMYVHLFREPSRIAQPREPGPAGGVLVLAAVSRPGHDSILLTGQTITNATGRSEDGSLHWGDEVLRLIESIIRDFVDQWVPDGSLWDAPAEDSLREYLAARNTSGD